MFKSISDLELNSFRTFVPFVLTTLVLATKRKLPSVPDKGFGFVVGWSLTTESQSVLMYISVNYLPLGTLQSLIMTTSLTAGTLPFYIFLKEKISGFKLLGILMAVLGIIFVNQPEVLFNRQFNSGKNKKEILLNKTVEDGTNIQRSQLSMEHITFTTASFGFTFAVLSGICRAADSLILKYLSNNMSIIDNIWSILFWSFMNRFLLSVTIMYFLETFTHPRTISQVVWSLTHGVSYFLVWPFYIIAIPKLKGSTFIVLLSSFTILFMVLGQYTFLRNIQPGHPYSIDTVGIVLVLCGSTITSVLELF